MNLKYEPASWEGVPGNGEAREPVRRKALLRTGVPGEDSKTRLCDITENCI